MYQLACTTTGYESLLLLPLPLQLYCRSPALPVLIEVKRFSFLMFGARTHPPPPLLQGGYSRQLRALYIFEYNEPVRVHLRHQYSDGIQVDRAFVRSPTFTTTITTYFRRVIEDGVLLAVSDPSSLPIHADRGTDHGFGWIVEPAGGR